MNGKCKYEDIDKIVFTSDYLSHYKPNELQSLFTIASLYDAKIDVLHIVKEKELSDIQKDNKAYLDTIFKNIMICKM
mgnify:CR=1 FL=1